MSKPIEVLLVEDDPMVQEINLSFIERVEGFAVTGVARNGEEALEKIKERTPDLVILDLYMPGKGGLETLRMIRRDEQDVDVIAVTAANDRETVLRVMRLGAVDYIFKPFQFERIQASLVRYREQFLCKQSSATFSQTMFDRIYENATSSTAGSTVRDGAELHYPKGIQAFTLQQVTDCLRQSDRGMSAEEISQLIGMSRVTVRRYLEYLESVEQARSVMNYGTVGRPMKTYVWLA
ncbi:two-component system response regulator DctR [Aneurinibacillus soli]|uniref:Transcriptional regulatory protein n=1 Tax=Aneurinibacillus soli TaxID=1500254 RepID=A0A0U5B8V8_9BACL|nr:response regulator [Aneurinibacillus soli]PYE62619.1 two-component system response regulator DctR [Aneurinibacillus soli]BAU27181.1 Transcriptional regulatory protein CitT [Aneurinibacillus soli]